MGPAGLQKITAQKIKVKYLQIHPGDFAPIWCFFKALLCCI